MHNDKRQPVVELLDPMMVQRLRQQTHEDRLQSAFALWETAKVRIRGTVRQEPPDWKRSFHTRS